MNQFLIPANSKKSMLIFGIFRPIDLIIFCIGAVASILMLIIIKDSSIAMVVIKLLPLLTVALLVFPVANYHNTLTVLITIYEFYTTRQKYIWKGWCANDGAKDKSKK